MKIQFLMLYAQLELIRNLVAHGDAREGRWRGNWRMEWVASTLTPPPNVVYPALLKLMRTPRLPAVDWTDAPTDLNGLVCFRERRNLVSARVPSRSTWAIQQWNCTNIFYFHAEDLVPPSLLSIKNSYLLLLLHKRSENKQITQGTKIQLRKCVSIIKNFLH